ncbi:MFS transporter [Aquirhabdus sp.]|uniref:MFS transporter n=1 Tax=Aquirhabdus sp. TaxID=2824160 RepID=UPI00396C68D8
MEDISLTHQHTPTYTLGLLLSLYIAQGLPAGFLTQALPAILRQYHVSLAVIGWSGLLLFPWAVKFLWAPMVDHHYSEKVGQSRSWILPLSSLAILILLCVAMFEPTSLVHPTSAFVLFGLLFLLSIVGATQDIATDGLAVRMLGSEARSAGNAVQVTGYRIGLIVGGGVLLIVMDYWSWMAVFFAMIGLVILNTLPVLFFKEPLWLECKTKQAHSAQSSLSDQLSSVEQLRIKVSQFWAKFQIQFGYFWSNTEMRAWLLVLLVFKIADYMSSGMVKPMMVDMGFSLSKIGFWGTILGSASSLVGAALAALLMRHMRRVTALWVFNGLQALTTGLYSLIAFLHSQGYALQGWELYAANAIEHVAAAMAMVGLLTVAMDYARPAHAGSDFTFQVCAMTVLGGMGYLISGYLANGLGYAAQFGLSAGLGIILLLPIIYWGRLFHQPPAASTSLHIKQLSE